MSKQVEMGENRSPMSAEEDAGTAAQPTAETKQPTNEELINFFYSLPPEEQKLYTEIRDSKGALVAKVNTKDSEDVEKRMDEGKIL